MGKTVSSASPADAVDYDATLIMAVETSSKSGWRSRMCRDLARRELDRRCATARSRRGAVQGNVTVPVSVVRCAC